MAMRSHKVKVVVPDSHEIQVRLPSDFPTGVAELEVKVALETATETSGVNVASEFKRELAALLRRLPSVPILPDTAFNRDQIYDD